MSQDATYTVHVNATGAVMTKDVVAGVCGPWITLDGVTDLKEITETLYQVHGYRLTGEWTTYVNHDGLNLTRSAVPDNTRQLPERLWWFDSKDKYGRTRYELHSSHHAGSVGFVLVTRLDRGHPEKIVGGLWSHVEGHLDGPTFYHPTSSRAVKALVEDRWHAFSREQARATVTS
jgi:hypothetical protein